MPLSEHEKRMLQEMEAALMTEDPRLVSALSGQAKPIGRNNLILALGLVVLGIVVLFGGLIAKMTPVGVLGFVIALGGVITAISSIGRPSLPKSKRGSSMSARLEQRWDKRNNQ
jgi:uncharacterized membrane protein HdeD (DUF308 family)